MHGRYATAHRKANPGVLEAIMVVGHQRALARLMGVGQSTINKWLYSNIPAERAISLERHTGVPREQIRPDIFTRPEQPQSPPEEPQEAPKETNPSDTSEH